VCPCSKEISVAGAHNQRAWLRVKLRTVPGRILWFEELIPQLESFGSCEIYPLVKRPDEKFVTERGYFNPKFVEDVLRDTVLWLRQHPLITWFAVECEADESIHLHNAFAYQQEPPTALTLFSRDLTAAATQDAPDRVLVASRGGAPAAPVTNGATHSNGHSNGRGLPR
jgi:GTP cyclohydrolase I